MPLSKFSQGRKRQNFFHTILLVGGIFLLLCLIGWLFAGLNGVFYAAGLSLFFVFFGPHVSPSMLLRLFKAQPLAPSVAPQIYLGLEDLARKARLASLPKLYHVQSQTMNAFSLGSKNDAAIVLTDGLLRGLRYREFMAVLAHEMSHIGNNDMRVMSIADIFSRLTSLFSSLGQILLLINLPLLLMGMITVPWSAVLLLIFTPSLSNLLQLGLSRTREYEADQDAVLLTGDPQGLIDALRKIEFGSTEGTLRKVFDPRQRRVEPSLFRTHPVTTERIERLRILVEKQGEENPYAGGEEPVVPENMRPRSKPRRRFFSGLWY